MELPLAIRMDPEIKINQGERSVHIQQGHDECLACKLLADPINPRSNCLPKCGSMRRKIARAVEGCLYNFLNVVPGSFSRYSKEARLETDILVVSQTRDSKGYRFIMI